MISHVYVNVRDSISTTDYTEVNFLEYGQTLHEL